MNITSQALRGYAENAASTRDDRRSEYDIVARVTRELRDAATKAKTDFPAYVAALHMNQKLWTTIVVDLVEEKNPLPNELKARLVYLSEFTNHHTRKILRNGASVMPLLEVNLAVMRGLNAQGSET